MSQIVYKKASFVKRSFKAKRVLYYWSLLPFHPFRGQTYCFRQNCQSYPRHGGWRRSRMIHFHQHSLFFVAFFSAASIAVWRNGIARNFPALSWKLSTLRGRFVFVSWHSVWLSKRSSLRYFSVTVVSCASVETAVCVVLIYDWKIHRQFLAKIKAKIFQLFPRVCWKK